MAGKTNAFTFDFFSGSKHVHDRIRKEIPHCPQGAQKMKTVK